MAPFRFDEERREVLRCGPAVRARLRARAADIPERTQASRGPLSSLAFHLASSISTNGVLPARWRVVWRAAR